MPATHVGYMCVCEGTLFSAVNKETAMILSLRTEPENHGVFRQRLLASRAVIRAWAGLISALVLFGIVMFGSAPQTFGAGKDTELVLHGVCKHFSSQRKDGQPWNERNPGMAIRIQLNQKDTLALQGGFYENSYFLKSFYAGIDWLPIRQGPLGFGAGIGTATGYQAFGGPLVPIGTLVTQWKATERLTIRLRMLPPLHPKLTGVAALEIGFRLPKISSVAH
jgi:hypothetical protein